jgi:tRNA (adenine22-N1)-methyltransferase
MSSLLSKRMKMIVDMVTPGRVTADIGCDHGLVSVYLIKNNIAPRVYAMDIGEGPLRSAKKNISEALSEEEASKIELRLSDGFTALAPGESESAIIAGMGGYLIISILEGGLHNSVISPGYELLLSPQSDVPMVRRFLRENGFSTIDEEMLIEEGKYYNIIKTVYKGTDKDFIENMNSDSEPYNIDDIYGRILLEKKSPVLRHFLENEVEKKEKLFCTLSKQSTENSINRLASLKNEIESAAKALGHYM